MDGEDLEYVGAGVTWIHLVDIDKVSRFEVLEYAKNVGFANVKM